MNPEKLTARTREALLNATQSARDHNHSSIMPAHLGLALLAQQQGIVYPSLDRLGVNPVELRRRLEAVLGAEPKAFGDVDISGSSQFNRTLDRADQLRQRMSDDYLSIEHLLLALSEDDGPTGDVFRELGLDSTALTDAVTSVRGAHRVTSEDPESTLNALEQYGRDLTADARQGKLDPVIGRDDEIRRVIQVLSRRTKNNPVLIGEPGVGKTAIVEGLARRIADGDVPEGLKSKRIVALSMNGE